MRIIPAISLLFCLILPQVSMIGWIKYEQHLLRKKIKRQIIAGIHSNELSILRFSKKEIQKKLRWKHSKEFEYGGEMYDVVRRENRGDSVVYWCWWDHEETALNKQLDNLVNYCMDGIPQREDHQHFLDSILENLFLAPAYFRLDPYQTIFRKNFPSFRHRSYTCIAVSPPVPPPERW